MRVSVVAPEEPVKSYFRGERYVSSNDVRR